MPKLEHIPKALIAAWDRFNTDHGWALASHVAMSMMLALFPFCIFVLAVAVQLSTGLDQEALAEFVFGAWPDEIAEPIVRELLLVLEHSSARTAIIGAALALFFASNGVDAVRVAITQAYREHDPRPWWRTRALALVFVLGGAATLLLAGGLAVGVPLYFRFVADAAPELYTRLFSNEAMRAVLAVSALLFAVFAAHKWLPGVHRPLSALLPGILLTIVLWVAVGWIFAAYLRSFGSYSLTYAGLAGIMAALVFLYMMAAIFVFCAEFNGQLMRLAEV